MSNKLFTTASLAALIAAAAFATPASAQSLFAFMAPPAQTQTQAAPQPQAVDPAPGQDDKAALDFLNGAYVSGLAGLKKALEAR